MIKSDWVVIQVVSSALEGKSTLIVCQSKKRASEYFNRIKEILTRIDQPEAMKMIRALNLDNGEVIDANRS